MAWYDLHPPNTTPARAVLPLRHHPARPDVPPTPPPRQSCEQLIDEALVLLQPASAERLTREDDRLSAYWHGLPADRVWLTLRR